MLQCSVCEKQIYGHSTVKSGKPVVCGSCTLTKTADSKPGKNQHTIRLELAKNIAKDVIRRKPVMTDVVVKSNYARSRTILLDGRYPLSFDSEGKARIPAHLRESFEREMAAKPGRYSFDVPPVVHVVQDVAPKAVELVAVPAKKEALVDSELSDEQPKKAVPAVAVKSKKK